MKGTFDRQKERQRKKVLFLLAHSPNGCNGWSWEPGVSSGPSTWVQGPTQVLERSSTAFSSRKQTTGLEGCSQDINWNHMGCLYNRVKDWPVEQQLRPPRRIFSFEQRKTDQNILELLFNITNVLTVDRYRLFIG